MNNGSLNWKAASDLGDTLQGIDPDAFREAVERQSRQRLSEFADGVKRYRHFRRQPRPTEPDVIWTEGATRLLDYGIGADGVPVLFIPSLINRGYILDLDERRSMMRDLAGRGFRPLLVDWGAPEQDESEFTLDDYIAGRLVRILDAAYRINNHPVAVAGYCMGGTMALALATLRPEQVSALILMAAPWDFHATSSGKIKILDAMMPVLEKLLETTPCLPVDVLQALFTSLDPYLTADKFRAFASLNPRTAKARRFVALEDWLNDGVGLAGPTAVDCLRGWYINNEPGRGVWMVAGMPVQPERINLPSLVVVPMLDHIVPPDSALPLAEKLPDSSCLRINAGHIGMVAGSRAKGTLYTPVAKWLDRALSRL